MSYTDNQREITGRDVQGRFAAGNPGRPYGAKGKTSREALERIKLMKETAIQKLWESVNIGERWAIEFVLSKVLPASRTIEFEGLTTEDIKAALISGDISPDEAKAISGITRDISEMEFLKRMRSRFKS
ncbi:MAG TPA: hypothetical protein VFT64_01705 [Rickettsiales bacterium]|nr:hypothetical protein [Rickettsiales bacterium]